MSLVISHSSLRDRRSIDLADVTEIDCLVADFDLVSAFVVVRLVDLNRNGADRAGDVVILRIEGATCLPIKLAAVVRLCCVCSACSDVVS